MPDEAPARDPYLCWSKYTGWHHVLREPGTGRLAVAIECVGTVSDLGHQALTGVDIAEHYRLGGVIDPQAIRYCTALVDPAELATLETQVKRLKLGMAVARHGGQAMVAPASKCRTKVVSGLIDDFVAYAHPRFLDAEGGSRVRHVWSQDATRPACVVAESWRPCADFPYGYELDTQACAHGGVALPDTYPSVLRRWTHGTHVADLAAGGHAVPDKEALPDIVAVHLPRRGVADTSGSALKMQVLDALHYIVERAGPDASVVVNLSYGTMAGPHDGQTILEQAIDELVALRRGRLWVVVPAGNSREARCHAVVKLNKSKKAARLRWKLLPDDATPSWLEIWLPAGAAVEVKLLDPGRTCRVRCAKGEMITAPAQGALHGACGVIYLDRVADSPDNGTMILVALAPTVSTDPKVPTAAAGVWTVELSHDGQADLGEIHAWIERDDTPFGHPTRGRQSYFVDPKYEAPGQRPGAAADSTQAYVKRRGAFNTIATGAGTLVAGAYVGQNNNVARYSGGGPTRRPERLGPSLLARGDESPTLHGLLAAGTGAADRVRMNGTSVAAPRVTREVAQILNEVGAVLPRGLDTDDMLQRLAKRLVSPPLGAKPGPPDPEREGLGRLPAR
jgi:subtilisin family serine protease